MDQDGRPRADTSPTGVGGLDDILTGGLPRDRLYLLQGDPGVGKTTLALQWLLDGARNGERCLYVSLSETREELKGVATSHGWALSEIDVFELPMVAADLEASEDNTLFHPSEVELAETTKVLLREVDRVNPSRVVVDSLSEIRLLAQNPLRYRRQVLGLKQAFVGRRCTVMLLDDRTASDGDLQLQSLAHGVIALEQLSPLYGAQRRRLRVLKLRGVGFRGGYHDFTIETGGVRVYPRLVASTHRQTFEPYQLTSGVPALDALMGGGIDGGTSTLLMGPAGTGKSTVTMQYAAAAARAGKRVAMFAFDESPRTVLARAAAVGIELDEHLSNGQIEIRQVDPAELSPGEFVHAVRQSVEERGASLVVIDSLNGYMHAMPEEQFLTLQLHELLTYLGQMGVVTMMVAAQHGFLGSMRGPVEVSYLADAVMVFRHFEAEGRLRKAVSVLKKRTGAHESMIRELVIGPNGVRAGEPLEQFRGIMTGVPTTVNMADLA
jgi:circadian clock protein KaiC